MQDGLFASHLADELFGDGMPVAEAPDYSYGVAQHLGHIAYKTDDRDQRECSAGGRAGASPRYLATAVLRGGARKLLFRRPAAATPPISRAR